MTKDNKTSTTAPHVVLFCSRNKDQDDSVKGFKERSEQYLSAKPLETLMERFQEFVNKGVPGEFCRFYVSVNARDNEKIRVQTLHYLLDNPDQDMTHINSRVVSIAAHEKCAATKKWMFDFDTTDDKLEPFIEAIRKCGGVDENTGIEVHPTPNGKCIIVEHGFDVGSLKLGSEWKDIELKKDAMLCYAWDKKAAE